MAHAVHNVCEYIVKLYPQVNELVSNGKKIIVKSNERRNQFKKLFPKLSLPPEPVRTRWGQWIDSIPWYGTHLEQFSHFLFKLDSNDSKAIKTAQELISNQKSKLICDLSYINANFNCLSKLIKQLETQEMLLFDSLNLIDSTLKEMTETNGAISEKILQKFKFVLNKNKGLKRILDINTIITGTQIESIENNLTPEEMSVFKWAPITTCDVERSFSRYKLILNDRRYNLSESHLKYYFIINSNRDFLNNSQQQE